MAHIIQIGNRRWLAGMTWSSYEDAPRKSELKEDAQRLGASWVSVRVGESAIQAGFCEPVENVKGPTGLYSIAAMLADSRKQPWLGVFKIEEGLWWYIAVRDGHAILPDGDEVGGAEEINAARERHSGYADWRYIEGDIEDLAQFINEVEAKPTRVRSLVGIPRPTMPMIVSAAVLVSALGGGYWWWQQKQLEQERVAAVARARAIALANLPPALVPSTLLTTPSPNDWVAVCGLDVLALPLSKKGWELDKISCDLALAKIHWLRKDGATVAERPDGVLSADGDAVDQVIALAEPRVQGINDAIALPAAKAFLRAWAQAANFTLDMNEVPPIPLLPGASVASANAPGMQQQATFGLHVTVSPFDIDFSSIPGLRLTSLKVLEAGWQLEGILYGR